MAPLASRARPAVAFALRREEALHDDLVRAVGGHGEKCAAN